ncbi:type II toxin-antitoxin system HicB family antitoxin [candidate division KSB3 bacterium]|uniref:Type II toxin-antitoxin system HicB family antitoxin n=1 Tax=candidate division KSB3 bacterium TaxID=2044937 RepID=A0A9D5JS20_9BACT|nr:type II toxin-antitoxin system HicB family antitoxin [candidate division KSB3 bacterium]MBD3322972.1 type II toxin-antitoxin system HicB family antitoxin [candidate division KSB3 bacterium]
MKKYLIILEKTSTGYSAYSPDVIGCIATGSTKTEVKQNMREAIESHLEGLQREGCAVPQPHSSSTYIEVAL